MMKVIATHSSVYGSSKEYAEEFARRIKGDVLDLNKRPPRNWADKYEIIVHFGSLYATGMRGIKRLIRGVDFKKKKVVIVSVGLHDPSEIGYRASIDMNIPLPQRQQCKIFHLCGRIEVTKLTKSHRLLIKYLINYSKRHPKSTTYSYLDELEKGAFDGMDFKHLLEVQDYVNDTIGHAVFKARK